MATVELAPGQVETGLVTAYRAMVVARRVDRQALLLTRQGALGVYPSSHGQEATEVGAVLGVEARDWLFPTYRQTMALVTRGLDPVEILRQFQGHRHCGFDPVAWRVAPYATPIATQLLHATGLAMAAKRRGDDLVALAFCGDGATSEGDFHEALNFAAVFQAPCVFLVSNNHWAISVPLERQTRAATLADKAIGYGMPGERIDGNDVMAVIAAVRAAAGRAREGGGPTLIESVTYRIEAHTNADDPSRYRDEHEVEEWRERDPIARLEREFPDVLDEAVQQSASEQAEAVATHMREGLTQPPSDTFDLFAHVYAQPTPRLQQQREALEREQEAS